MNAPPRHSMTLHGSQTGLTGLMVSLFAAATARGSADIYTKHTKDSFNCCLFFRKTGLDNVGNRSWS